MYQLPPPRAYTPYRRTLAWIGFIAAYIIVPVALALTIYTLRAGTAHPLQCTQDRPEPFYQQVSIPISYGNTAVLPYVFGILHDAEVI